MTAKILEREIKIFYILFFILLLKNVQLLVTIVCKNFSYNLQKQKLIFRLGLHKYLDYKEILHKTLSRATSLISNYALKVNKLRNFQSSIILQEATIKIQW